MARPLLGKTKTCVSLDPEVLNLIRATARRMNVDLPRGKKVNVSNLIEKVLRTYLSLNARLSSIKVTAGTAPSQSVDTE